MTFHGDTSFISKIGQSNAIASLAEVKEAARVETSDEDAYLQLCMVQAQTFLEGKLARQFDNANYEVDFKFDYPPRKGDKLWISVAPVDEVTLDGAMVSFKKTPNGFDSYVLFQDGWDQDELVLAVSTEWGDWLDKIIKVPFLTVCATYYRYREFTLARDAAVNNVVMAAIRPYRREV